MQLNSLPDSHLNILPDSPAIDLIKKKEETFFTFIEMLKKLVALKEKEEINKTIDDIPANKMELINDYDPDAVINSFSDYIEWVLDFSYSFLGEKEFHWLNLLLADGNDKLLEEIADGNNIPIQYLYMAVTKRLLNDLEKNFDAYEEFYHLKFVE